MYKLIYFKGQRYNKSPKQTKQKKKGKCIMTQREFNKLMSDSKRIINDLTREIVLLREMKDKDLELITNKETELKKTVENMGRLYLLYYGIE